MNTHPITDALVDEFGPGADLSHQPLARIEDVILDAIRDGYSDWDTAHDAACSIASRWESKTLPGTRLVWS